MRFALSVVFVGCCLSVASPAKDKHKSLDDTADTGKGLNFYSIEKELVALRDIYQG